MAFAAVAVFAGVPVRDIEAAISWYQQVFGRDPDSRPVPQIADYYLAEDRIPEHGTLQLRVDESRAGGGLVTLNVRDVESILHTLNQLGVGYEVVTTPIQAETVDSVTIASFGDLDGNLISLVQPHSREALEDSGTPN